MRTPLLALFGCMMIAGALGAQSTQLPIPVRIDSGVSGHIHPALCISKKGTLIGVYCKSEYKPYLITRSLDMGKTWSKPLLFPHTTETQVYPGSLTTLSHVAFSVSDDDGITWSKPKNINKNKDQKIESVIRHPIVELAKDKWLLPLMDRTVLYNPITEEESAFGDGRNHGLVPIVKTPKSTLVSGKGMRSTDEGKNWIEVKPFPDVSTQGWRHQMICLENGLLLASQIVGPGVGGDVINYLVSKDDGKTWLMDNPVEFYNPSYDTDAKQAGGSGVFFRTMPIALLIK
jgi:hypothetical protein